MLRVVFALVCLLFSAAGCSGAGRGEVPTTSAPEESPTNEVTANAPASPPSPTIDAVLESSDDRGENLEVGDCVDSPLGAEVTVIEIVSCDGPWEYIVLGLVSFPDGPYPGRVSIDLMTNASCDPATTFVIRPSEISWAAGDRAAHCVLQAEPFRLNQSPPGTCFSSATPISCSSPHAFEIYHLEDLPEQARFPGYNAVAAASEQICLEAFERYVGRPFEASMFVAIPVQPSEATWDLLGARTVTCHLGSDTTLLVGSAKEATARS